MKNQASDVKMLAFLTAGLLTAQMVSAQVSWTGGGFSDTNWSNPANWSTATVPSGGDPVIFNDGGALTTVSNINNTVDGGAFAGSIASLQYSVTNGVHTTLIAPSQTLTVAGAFLVGAEGQTDLAAKTNTITGPGAALVVNGGNFVVRQGPNSGGLANRTTLDMSGLDVFTASVARICLSGATPTALNRSTGRLILARTNNITANGTSAALIVGESTSNNGSGSTLVLGQTNVLSLNGIWVGRVKENGSRIIFNTKFNSPVAFIRGPDGAGRVPIWTLGDGASDSGTTTCNGTADFTGGKVDALVETLQVGRGSSGGTGGNQSVGTVTFNSGTIDVNTLQMGFQGGSNPKGGSGSVNVNGTALLVVNTTLEMSRTVGGDGYTNCVSRLNINGGTVRAAAINAAFASTNSSITMTNGTLVVTNVVGSGVRTLAMTNSTIQLPAETGLPAMVVTSLITGGTTNQINIDSIGVVTSYPFQFTIIQYSGTIGGAGFNFGRGTLPSSPSTPFAGYISNNTANASVDFVLTAGPTPPNTLTWRGTPDGAWNAGAGTSLNWLVGATPTNFNQGDFVTFDDSASGTTTVDLQTTLLPANVTVNNSAKNYTFAGAGALSGETGLNKQGTGKLTLDNGGFNDFTGPITIGGGTLQIGNNDTGGTLPAAPSITDNATLAFNRTDDLVVSNSISGTGAIVQDNTTGVLRLAGNNSFTDAVTVVHGTLVPSGNTALGTTAGPTIINSGATLDVGPNNLAANGLNLGTEPVTVSGTGVGGSGAVVNSSFVAQQNALRVVTLVGHTTFGGTGRWDIRGAGATLMTGGNAYDITKIGANQVSLVGVNPIDATLGNINVQAGIFAIQTTTTQLGDPSKTITVAPGATLNTYNLTAAPLNKQVVLTGNGDGTTSSWDAENGNSTNIGPVTLNGTCIFGVRGTTLNLAGPVSGTGQLFKNGVGTLILGGEATPGAGTYVDLGTLIVNGNLAGGLTNAGGTILAGSGTNLGPLDVFGTLNPGGTAGPGTFTAAGGVTFEGSAGLAYDLTPTNTPSGGWNDLLQVFGDINANGNPFTINPLQGRLQAGTYRLIGYTGSLLGGGFGAASPAGPSRYGFTLDTSTAHQVNLLVSGSSANVKWASTSDSTWDISGVQNWINLANSAVDFFYNGDSVLLDDSVPGVTNRLVISSGVAVQPWAITNNSGANDYTIMGPGRISGSASIVKSGSSALTILSANDFTGPVTVESGTLKIGHNSALGLGASSGGTTIASGATLDLGGTNMAANTMNVVEQITVSGTGVGGNGAIVNSNTNQQQYALHFVTLAGDAALGGAGTWQNNLYRWDIRGTNTDIAKVGSAYLSTAGHAYNLTKVGSNLVCIVGVLLDPALANIDIRQGALSIEHATTLGDPTKTLTATNGATLQVWQTWPSNLLNKVFVFYGDGVNTNIQNGSGSNIIVGPVTLNTNVLVNCLANTSLTFSNDTIGGSGALTKIGPGLLILKSVNTFTGNTTVSAGTLALADASDFASSPILTVNAGATLDVTGRTDGTLTLGSGQTLQGNGTINGSLTVGPGATVAPGTSIGALNVSNIVTLQGTTTMELGTGTNDVIRAGSLAFGGTLNLAFTPGTLSAGNSFKLFYAPPAAGSFTITPSSPGPALRWDTSLLNNNGILAVAAVPRPRITSAVQSDGNLVISGTNSTSMATSNYWVLTSTNVALPLSNWTSILTNTFDALGNFGFTNAIDPGTPSRFFILQVP